MPETRLSAAGYADTRPLYPPNDPRSVTLNRRVEVVVLSTLPARAALLPAGIAKAGNEPRRGSETDEDGSWPRTRQAAEGAEAPKKSKKKLIIIVLAVLLLGGGGAGAYFMFFKAAARRRRSARAGRGRGAGDASPSTWPTGDFLKVSIALQASADAAQEPEGSKALDLLISQFSNKSVAELSSNDAREEQKKELVEKVREGL